MKNKVIIVASIIMIMLFLAAFIQNFDNKNTIIKEKTIKVENIDDYVVKIPTYKSINEQKALDYIAKGFDGWSYDTTNKGSAASGGCTALAKVVANGDMIMGRNMDLTQSFKPEYVFYMDVPGKYKSFNVTYLPELGDTYKYVLKKGLNKEVHNYLPYLVTDAMNEEGLAIELNMRNDEYDLETGELIMGSSGTNPKAKLRISSMSVVRYLADNAKDVNEALSLLGATNYKTKEKYGEAKVDVYSLKSSSNSNNFAYMISDASGNYGLIEIVDNKVVFFPKQSYQANYYIGNENSKKELYGAGFGRTNTIMKDYNKIDNMYDMMATMKKIRYSDSYKVSEAKFDTRSEFVHLNALKLIDIMKEVSTKYNIELPDYSHITQTMYNPKTKRVVKVNYEEFTKNKDLISGWTSDFLLDNKNKKEVNDVLVWFEKVYNKFTEDELKELGLFWTTAHQITYNSTQKYVIISFFEDDSTTRTFSLK